MQTVNCIQISAVVIATFQLKLIATYELCLELITNFRALFKTGYNLQAVLKTQDIICSIAVLTDNSTCRLYLNLWPLLLKLVSNYA